MFKQKKGQLFVWFLVIMTAVALTGALIGIGNKYNVPIIGEKQLAIVKTYAEGEKSLLFIDQIAKYSTRQAIYDLGINGGFYFESSCGKKRGYNLWKEDDINCFPTDDDIKKGFNGFFKTNMDSYSGLYPGVSFPSIASSINLDISSGDVKLSSEGGFQIELEINTYNRDTGQFVDYNNPSTDMSYSVPDSMFTWPADSKTISSGFGNRQCGSKCDNPSVVRACGCPACKTTFHNALDISTANQPGFKGYAAANGTVAFADKLRGIVIIDHEDGFQTKYFHLKDVYVKPTQVIKEKGFPIGEIGNTGTVNIHLHFELWKNGIPVDPLVSAFPLDDYPDTKFQCCSNVYFNRNVQTNGEFFYPYHDLIESRTLLYQGCPS